MWVITFKEMQENHILPVMYNYLISKITGSNFDEEQTTYVETELNTNITFDTLLKHLNFDDVLEIAQSKYEKEMIEYNLRCIEKVKYLATSLAILIRKKEFKDIVINTSLLLEQQFNNNDKSETDREKLNESWEVAYITCSTNDTVYNKRSSILFDTSIIFLNEIVSIKLKHLNPLDSCKIISYLLSHLSVFLEVNITSIQKEIFLKIINNKTLY